MGQTLDLSLRIPPEWARIDPVRQAVGLCAEAAFASEDMRDALGMVCAELLENAIKYGKPDAGGIRIHVTETADDVVVEVTNAVEDVSHHAAQLRERIAWITSFETPSEAYMAALSQVYERAEAIEGGLGLVRIAYEGACQLACETTDGLLTVRARYRRARGAEA
jgi:hypothetical protein